MDNDQGNLVRFDGRGIMINSLNKIFNAFKINAKCVDANTHRHFAYYDVELDPGTRISRIQRYANELAIAMRANSAIIVKAVPSKGIVRLQTTLRKADTVTFDELYTSYSPPTDQLLPFLLGETDEGKGLWMDMAKNPHLLVAGATGSGKSVLLHTLINNAVRYRNIRVYLVDTKRVEFNVYANSAVNTVASVSNTYQDAMELLEHLNNMMDARYEYMAARGIQSVEERQDLFDNILLIVDEAADLMLYEKGKAFENLVAKLAQKARAAGIYMVFATQRPSVDVFTGLIKANFPARLSCKVTSKVDSKVVLDRQGAESLIGRGDAILHNSAFDMTRLQVAYSDPTQIVQIRS